MWQLAVFLVFLVNCCVFYNLTKSRRKWMKLVNIPCRASLPLLGNLPDFLTFISRRGEIPANTHMFQYLNGMATLYPDKGMFVLWPGPYPWLIVFSPESVEPIFNRNKGEEVHMFMKYVKPWLGNGLLTSEGKEWQQQRKLLTQAFHVRALDNFLPVINEQASTLVQKVTEASSKENFIDSFDFYLQCTLDIICETALDLNINAQGSDSTFARMIHVVEDAIVARFNQPWLHSDVLFSRTKHGRNFQRAVNYLHNFSEKVIAEKMSRRNAKQNQELTSDCQFESKPNKRLSLLDLLLESGLSQQEIREQVDTFIFAGFDTTGVTLGWITYLLGLHTDIQERLAEEVDYVFSEDRDRHVTSEDLRNLKYMEMVIKESMRMYPAIPVIPKKLLEDTRIGEYLIPKGTECMVSIYSLHRNPKHFRNPDVFDPERFSPENSVGRHPCAFIPFSSGLRNCIGQRYAMMELKIVLSHVLRSFRVFSLDPMDKILLHPSATLKPLGKIRTKFISREY